MAFIPSDLSVKNYTYENWKKMGIALAEIRAVVEKADDESGRRILVIVEKLEKSAGVKFHG